MFNIQSADTRENFRTAAHQIAAANGCFKTSDGMPKSATNTYLLDKNGNKQVDLSQIDMTQLTQGFLTTMCDITPQTQTLQFAMVDTQQVSGSPVTPLMRLLSMQDSFFVGSMSFYLFPYFFTNNQGQPNYAAGNYMVPLTYVSSSYNNQAATAPFLDAANSLFWSPGTYISIEVDKKVVVPYWDTLKHLYSPVTQANAQPNPLLTPNQWPLVIDQYDGSTDAYFPVDPTVVFGGGRQNIVKLNLPANVPAALPPFNLSGYGTTFILKAAITFHGILAQNSTSVK